MLSWRHRAEVLALLCVAILTVACTRAGFDAHSSRGGDGPKAVEAGAAFDLGDAEGDAPAELSDGDRDASSDLVLANSGTTLGQPAGACVAVPGCGLQQMSVDHTSQISDSGEVTEQQLTGSCGGEGALESSWRVSITGTGRYNISAEGSDFVPIVYVRVGCCDGVELACVSNATDASPLRLDLSEGDEIYVIVDGGSSGQNARVRLGR